MTEQRKPTLILDRGAEGQGTISVLEYDERGYGVRDHMLSSGRNIHDRCMRRRFIHMVALMGDNVEAHVTPAFLATEDKLFHPGDEVRHTNDHSVKGVVEYTTDTEQVGVRWNKHGFATLHLCDIELD